MKILKKTSTQLILLFTQLFTSIYVFAADGTIHHNISGGSSHGTGAAGIAGRPQHSGGGFQSLIFLVVIILLFYFVIIRPQMKQNKEHKQMLNEIKTGEEILTAGGIVGKIRGIGDNFVDLEVSNDVIIKVQRQSIAKVMPKGSVKAS